jgi:hypothetical protein
MGDQPEKQTKEGNLESLAAIADPIPPLEELQDDPTAVTAVYPTSPGKTRSGTPGRRSPADGSAPQGNSREGRRSTGQSRADARDPLGEHDERDTEVDAIPGTFVNSERIAADGDPARAQIFHDETSVADLRVPGVGVDAPALRAVDAMGIEQRAKLFSAIAESDRFYRRLTEERARAARGLTTFSILLVNLRLRQGGTDVGEVDLVLSRALRNYDICCRITNDELGLILPGASASATAAAARRLQQLLAELDVDAAIGGASWSPGVGVEELIGQARACLGKGQIWPGTNDGAPVDDRADALLWIDGFPHGLPVRASARQGRLQLLLELPFLRSGVSAYLSTRGSCHAATLKAATLDGDGEPILRLELAP